VYDRRRERPLACQCQRKLCGSVDKSHPARDRFPQKIHESTCASGPLLNLAIAAFRESLSLASLLVIDHEFVRIVSVRSSTFVVLLRNINVGSMNKSK